MGKQIKGKKLNRNVAQRKALYRGLFTSLVKHGKIKTTLTKAKAVRPQMEKLVTLARKGDLASRRRLLKILPQKETVAKILDEIGPRFKDRPGGYLRIIKLGPRSSDQTEMAKLEWVEEEVKSEKSKGKN